MKRKLEDPVYDTHKERAIDFPREPLSPEDDAVTICRKCGAMIYSRDGRCAKCTGEMNGKA